MITKKLEWKAAPKIGSLDHTYKKHGKGGSKGESKEGKVIDGQVSEYSLLISHYSNTNSLSNWIWNKI